ncbi:uncharacterized protein LTR77_006468 [Saxophila tyrrhenica]|uniref:RING-type domain-containing protein n=1 Tax=Saxophila tyrrhenica TaxID=1690608 RepID=A0AAV9PB00_9PEZI|nr:hypothetical protein LTR77_006468 [Saxophila tyrrhenica]
MTTCAQCDKPLIVEITPDSDSEGEAPELDNSPDTIPDDVTLSCGCHFHWECLLDSYELEKCPNCSRSIVSSPATGSSASASAQQAIIVDLNNEGGLQQQIDIFPILKEESYLRAYPEERKCRAFLEFAREGDYKAIAELLNSCDEQRFDEQFDESEMTDAPSAGGENKTPHEILRYQDPIGDMSSGLHAAVANGHREVAWLLLLLASSFPELEIPAEVYQEAAVLGVMRTEQDGKVDIRSLKDSHGRTAEDVAREAGAIWTGWIGNGRLAMP